MKIDEINTIYNSINEKLSYYNNFQSAQDIAIEVVLECLKVERHKIVDELNTIIEYSNNNSDQFLDKLEFFIYKLENKY